MKSSLIFLFCLWPVFGFAQAFEQKPVYEVLTRLGGKAADHTLNYTQEMVKRGRDIVFRGKAVSPSGQMGEVQSYYFKCIDCHNVAREDRNLTRFDPVDRLRYAKEKNIPFLPGTTFFGIVNRESWFNGDYEKKYGDLVSEAKDDLKEAIQVCSKECSSGRRLEQWELKSVLAYFWTLQLKIKDLNLSSNELVKLKRAFQRGQQNPPLVRLLRSKYALYSPASFGNAPQNRRAGYPGLVGDKKRGRDLFEQSCLHCHRQDGPSYYAFENDFETRSRLYQNRERFDKKSFYQSVREGIFFDYPEAYMPLFPLERLSNQQIEDLKAFFKD